MIALIKEIKAEILAKLAKGGIGYFDVDEPGPWNEIMRASAELVAAGFARDEEIDGRVVLIATRKGIEAAG